MSTWGRWGAEDEHGTLHRLTEPRAAAAARLVRDDVTVSLSLPLATTPGGDHPQPAEHRMTMLADTDIGSGSLRFMKDYVGVDYHSEGHSHVDALCHVAYEGTLYNGVPQGAVSASGAAAESVEILKDGLVGRGVLLDVPRVRGVPWLEPGEHVRREDLEAAEREQGVRVGEGDICWCAPGMPGAWPSRGRGTPRPQRPGCTRPPSRSSRSAASRCLAATAIATPPRAPPRGSPSSSTCWPSNAMGLPLLDYLQFEDLRVACERAGRWEFLLVAAPLRIVAGTGSRINPIAML